MDNILEKILWNDSKNLLSKYKIFRTFSKNIKCVCGFVIKEDATSLEISSTIGSQGYTDITNIKKEHIISREKFILKK